MPEPRAGAMNLKELAARPERIEHHLVPVATIGDVQLELATASEPLYFAHVNISDEYALALPTGDGFVDAFPLRTFLGDALERDVGRYNHRPGDVVLHPVGVPHWPGRMRAPYTPLAIPPGARRCALSLVYCATVPTPSAGVVVACEDDRAKAYVAPPPAMSLVATGAALGVIARIGDTTLAVVDGAVELPRGGWVVVLAGERVHDVIRVAAGGRADGYARALVFASATREPDAPPEAWRALPPPPFAPYEEAAPGALPLVVGELAVTAVSDAVARVAIGGAGAEVPRYWAARMLFRVALHGMRLGAVETYGGFGVDDGGGRGDVVVRIPGAQTTFPRASAVGVIERLYRGIAPAGYVERLT
jgi:hypothetical protein